MATQMQVEVILAGNRIATCVLYTLGARDFSSAVSGFVFIELFSCLCVTRRGWLCDFPPKQPRVAFGLPYLLIELFYIGIPEVRTDGRSVT